MEQDLGEVFDAIERFVRDLGTDHASALVEDSTALCRYVVNTERVEEAILRLDVLTGVGASTTLSLDVSGSSVVFTSTPTTSGIWKLSGDVADIGWTDDLDTEDIDSAMLLDHWRTISVVASASIEVLLEKERWAAPITSDFGGVVWVGPRLEGFVAWIADRPAESTLGVLFHDGPALVLLHDWAGATTGLGSSLTLASLTFRSTGSASEPPWPGTSSAWQRRALSVEIDACPVPLRAGLIRAVGWSAALLLAEESSSDEARPDRNATTRWRPPATPAGMPAVLPSVVALARWVSAEPSATRLAVARSVAGSRLPDPFATDGASAIVEAADIAYRHTVDSSVLTALSAQLELEQSFRSIDAEFTTVRSRLVEALDQTLLRAVAGLVAIAAAAAASDLKSAGFVRFGSLLVAGYIMFVAMIQFAMAGRDIYERLDAFEEVVMGRSGELAERVLDVLTRWRSQLRRRVRWMRWSLVAVSIVVGTGGLLVAASIDGKARVPPRTTPTTATTGISAVPASSLP